MGGWTQINPSFEERKMPLSSIVNGQKHLGQVNRKDIGLRHRGDEKRGKPYEHETQSITSRASCGMQWWGEKRCMFDKVEATAIGGIFIR